MKYVEKVECDVCGKDICMPNARIEWNYSNNNEMQICHHECSHGWKNDTASLSDIILNQGLYNENDVSDRLSEISNEIKYKETCATIIEKIFE